MGYMNHLDANGDSQGNFTLLARKHSPDDDANATYGLYPVGTFLLNENDTTIPVSRHSGGLLLSGNLLAE